MKKLLTTTFFAAALLFSACAQQPQSSTASADNVAYYQAMGQALGQWQGAKTPEDRQALVNSFDRIAATMPEEWLPVYYSALIQLQDATKLPAASAEQDKAINKVLVMVEDQLTKHPNNSELLALKGYRHMMYVAANPMARGQQYSGMAIAALQQAIQADDTNPRAYYLLGQMKLGMARFMQSSTDEACSLLNKAVSLYAEEEDVQSLAPSWGKNAAIEASAQCTTTN